MKSFILYSTLTHPTRFHCPIYDSKTGSKSGSACIYVRAELVDCDHDEAMDRVKPMEGETFLNTVPA